MIERDDDASDTFLRERVPVEKGQAAQCGASEVLCVLLKRANVTPCNPCYGFSTGLCCRFSPLSRPCAISPLSQIEPYLTGLRPKQLDEYHEAFRHSGVKTSARATSATRTTPRRGTGTIRVSAYPKYCRLTSDFVFRYFSTSPPIVAKAARQLCCFVPSSVCRPGFGC